MARAFRIGNAHLHEDLPTIIVGKGGNYFKTGRRVVLAARRRCATCS